MMVHPPFFDPFALTNDAGFLDHKSAQWLTSGEAHPYDVLSTWRRKLPATLRSGHRFDAVHLPVALVEAGIDGVQDKDTIEAHFRAVGISSSVTVSRTGHQYTVLVPPGTTRHWKEPGTTTAGNPGYVSLPTPVRHGPPGAYWLLPAPEDESMLCALVNLRLLIGKSKARGCER